MSSNYALDLDWIKPFTKPTFEPSCLGTTEIFVPPREIIDYSSQFYTFDLPNLGDRFLNLKSIKLYLSGSIKNSDGSNLTEADNDLCLVNNSLHSLFQNVSVTIGTNQCTIAYQDYPFLSLMQLADKVSSASQLGLNGYLSNTGDMVKGENLGRQTRKENSNKKQHYIGHLNCDIFQINSYLINHVPISIQLQKAKPDFYIQTTHAKSYNFVIDDIKIVFDCININPRLSETIHQYIKTKPAVYSFEHLRIKKFNIPTNSNSYTIPRIWDGNLPRRLVFAFINQDVYRGTKTSDPTDLITGKLKYLNLYVNEQLLFRINVSGYTVTSIQRLFEFMQVQYDCFIDQRVFKHSLPLQCLDLNKLCNQNNVCINEISGSGSLHCELEFEESTSESLILMLFTFTTAHLSITENREAAIYV